MSQITISEASVRSLPSLNRLFVDAVHNHFDYFPPGVRRQVVAQHSLPRLVLAWADSRRVLLIARSGNRIVGYAIGAAPRSGPAQLFWLYVEPDHRGANLGLRLLSRMLKVLAERGAESVSIATHDHRRYYERQGFRFIENARLHGVQMDILTFRIKA